MMDSESLALLEQAFDTIASGASIRSTATKFGLSNSTLWRLYRQKQEEMQREMMATSETEQELDPAASEEVETGGDTEIPEGAEEPNDVTTSTAEPSSTNPAQPPGRKRGKKRKSDFVYVDFAERNKKYSSADLLSATEAVKAGASIQSSSKVFNIPYSCLRRHVFKAQDEESTSNPPHETETAVCDEAEQLDQEQPAMKQESVELNSRYETVEIDDHETVKELTQSYCCACLKQNVALVTKRKSVQFLEDFLDEGLRGFNYTELKMCKKCSKLIQDIIEFKKTCSASLKSLKELVRQPPASNDEPMLESVVVKPDPDLIDMLMTNPTSFESVDEDARSDSSPSPSVLNVDLPVSTKEFKKEKAEVGAQEVGFMRVPPPLPQPKTVAKPKPGKAKRGPQSKPKQLINLQPIKLKLVSEPAASKSSYCSYCSHFFPEPLNDHYLKVHGFLANDSWTCKDCGSFIGEKDTFLEHFDTAHIRFPAPEKCPHCETTFEYREPYKVHVSKHNAEFECEFCHLRFYQYMIMRQHVETKHLGLKRCKHCRQAFVTEEEFQKHMEEEKKVREQNTCDVCKRTYSDKQSLRKHKTSTVW